MKRTVFGICVLIASVAAGLLMRSYPMSLLLVIEDNVWKCSFWLLLGTIFILLWFGRLFRSFLGIIVKLFIGIKHWWGKVVAHKHNANLLKGVLNSLKGNFIIAEKYLKRLKFNSKTGNDFKFLLLGIIYRKEGKYQESLVALNRVEGLDSRLEKINLWLDNGEVLKAEQLILNLYDRYPHNSEVIKFLTDVWIKRENWEELSKFLPVLYRKKIFDCRYLNELEDNIYRNLLLKNVSIYRKFWRKIPRYLRRKSSLVCCYIDLLFKDNDYLESEDLLAKMLDCYVDKQLLNLYVNLQSNDLIKWLERAERWLKRDPKNLDLLIALGKMCLHCQFYAKANYYFTEAVSIYPTIDGYILLGEALIAEGKSDQALLIFKQLRQFIS